MHSLEVDGEAVALNVNHDDDLDLSSPPLDQRVLTAVKKCPERTIRPARLATELGISVDDASAELCGLLAAVGGGEDGASFVFESTSGGAPPTMVFTFPSDFEARARRHRRSATARQAMMATLEILVRGLKVFVAFGLVISLAILSVAAIVILVAVLVAVARGGGNSNHHQASVMRRLRSLFVSLRQLLWCYVMFGGSGDGQDPYLRQVATNVALASSLCCGNPMNIWFWIRASQLSRRRDRLHRGWGLSHDRGYQILQRGTWGSNNENARDDDGSSAREQDEYRGLLSVAVEFLFGPTPFWEGPTEADKYKLRAAAIIRQSSFASQPKTPGISLLELMPYADRPPRPGSVLSESTQSPLLVSEAIRIVTHFNGVPAKEDGEGNLCTNPAKARFIFPELIAEADHALASYHDVAASLAHTLAEEGDSSSWQDLLYNNPNHSSGFESQGNSLNGRTSGRYKTKVLSDDVPPYLYERKLRLTHLSAQDFGKCVILGCLNYIGLLWVRQSIGVGGIIEIVNPTLLSASHAILAFLIFYSKLFLSLPLGRLVFIVAYNFFLQQRNMKRSLIAKSLNN